MFDISFNEGLNIKKIRGTTRNLNNIYIYKFVISLYYSNLIVVTYLYTEFCALDLNLPNSFAYLNLSNS